MQQPRALFLEDTSVGLPAGTLIARLEDLPDHGGKDILFTEGSHRLNLFVQRFEDLLYVYENRCPHAGTPLNLFGDRFLDTVGQNLICRTHGALFEPHSGKCVGGPCKGQYLRKVAFEVRGGAIYSL